MRQMRGDCATASYVLVYVFPGRYLDLTVTKCNSKHRLKPSGSSIARFPLHKCPETHIDGQYWRLIKTSECLYDNHNTSLL